MRLEVLFPFADPICHRLEMQTIVYSKFATSSSDIAHQKFVFSDNDALADSACAISSGIVLVGL